MGNIITDFLDRITNRKKVADLEAELLKIKDERGEVDESIRGLHKQIKDLEEQFETYYKVVQGLQNVIKPPIKTEPREDKE